MEFTFVADYDYVASNEGELSFLMGDKIRISSYEGDWFYGKHTKTQVEGWVAASYGHKRMPSPYQNFKPDQLLAKKKTIMADIADSEANFITALQEAINGSIGPLQSKDTPFKRSFLNDPAVAVCVNLLTDMLNACSNFSKTLLLAKTDADIANYFTLFAPNLQLFAQYAPENPKFLNAINTNLKNLTKVNKNFDPSFAIKPLEHYMTYRQSLQDYVWSTPESSPDYETLSTALDAIIAQTEYVDNKLKEETDSLRLLELQHKFTGNPIIFTPTRKLLKEFDIERLRIKEGEQPNVKIYKAHIFNDAFAYSVQNLLGKYKLKVLIELKGAVLERDVQEGFSNTFYLKSKNADQIVELLRIPIDHEAEDIFKLITSNIEIFKTKRTQKRISVIQMTSTRFEIPGVQFDKLGQRAAIIYRFLVNELQFADSMNALNVTFIQPLIDAAKGAVLSAALNNSSVNDDFDQEKSDAFFDSRAANTKKYKSQMITEALQDPDANIFLRSAEGITVAIREFTKGLEALCKTNNWSENIQIGSYFSSDTANALYNQLKSYSGSKQAMIRILKSEIFQQFTSDSERLLASIPGSLQEKLELPSKRIKLYVGLFQEISVFTARNSVDFSMTDTITHKLQDIDQQIVEIIKTKENFETLLAIQASFVTVTNDPFLQKLATIERVFLKLGDLEKVCRKKNKTFRFWLFNDYLIYGTPLGGDSYSLNRSLDLKKCTVVPHTSTTLKNAIEIFGAEKSFIMIARTSIIFQEWLEALQTAVAKAKVSAGISPTEQTAAPLWAQDSSNDSCQVCKKLFTFWNRRHHCRKCGGLFCADHLKNREVLSYIHPTQKQKTCDDCFNGKNKITVPVVENIETPKPKDPIAADKNLVNTTNILAKPKPSPLVSSSSTSSATASPTHPKPLATAASSSTPPPIPKSEPLPTNAPPPIPKVAPEADLPTPPPVPTNTESKQSILNRYNPSKTESTPVSVSSDVAELKALEGKSIMDRYKPKEASPTTPPPKPLPHKRSVAPPAQTPPQVEPVTKALEATSIEPVQSQVPPPVPQLPPAPVVPPVPQTPPVPETKKEDPVPPSRSGSMIAPPPPPPPPSRSGSMVAPPPPAPQSAPQPADPAPPAESTVSTDDPFWKYIKMKDMLPPGAVRQKMTTDGFSGADIEAFLAGQVTTLPIPDGSAVPPPRAPLVIPTINRSALPAPAAAPKLSLQEEILRGQKLKAVQVEENKPKDIPQNAGGILGMLAMEMSKRRFNMNANEEDDSDSDSGFSDSDSDDD